MKLRLVKFPSRPSVLDRTHMSERRQRAHAIAERLASVEDRMDSVFGINSEPALISLVETLVTKVEERMEARGA
jgi:hypothetical protein